MDIIFNCPHCDQELAVDSSGAGSEIECPACGETITIPQQSTKPAPDNLLAGGALAHQPVNAIASSAAAKVEMHLKVPVREKPADPLISKPKPPLEAVARGADKIVRVRTIRRASCIESGHDKFDERVAEFLNHVGEANIVSILPINYEQFDVGVQKVMTDYGLVIIYRG